MYIRIRTQKCPCCGHVCEERSRIAKEGGRVVVVCRDLKGEEFIEGDLLKEVSVDYRGLEKRKDKILICPRCGVYLSACIVTSISEEKE